MEAGWGPGVHQNFSGPDGLAVLASIDPDTIVVLTPDLRRCINSAVDGENTLPVALYPARDPYPVEHGLAIELGAAMDHDSQPNAVIRDDRRDTCTWVQKDFWPYYESNGGPSGPLGYPLDRAHNEGDDKIQEFENGSIVLRSDGSLVAIAHGDGRSGPPSTLAPPGRSGSDGPADAAPGPGELAYRVSSQYGVSYPIEPGGYVEQEFTSQREAVHTVAVNAAWDSSRVNILLGDPALPGSRVVPQACALVVGHADDPRPSYRAVGRSCALSGFVG